MKNLSNALRDVATFPEELWQRGEVSARRSPVGVEVDHPGGVRTTSRQERRSAGPAHGLLTPTVSVLLVRSLTRFIRVSVVLIRSPKHVIKTVVLLTPTVSVLLIRSLTRFIRVSVVLIRSPTNDIKTVVLIRSSTHYIRVSVVLIRSLTHVIRVSVVLIGLLTHVIRMVVLIRSLTHLSELVSC